MARYIVRRVVELEEQNEQLREALRRLVAAYEHNDLEIEPEDIKAWEDAKRLLGLA